MYTGVARSIGNTFFEVGHTHNGVDRRFARVGGLLAQQRCLQTPSDFASTVEEGLVPEGGREIRVELLPGPWLYNSIQS